MADFDPVSYMMGQKAGGGGGGGSSTLAGLTDVDISNPSNGQTLTYNATSGKWKNYEGGPLVVHKSFNMDTGITVLDATFAEIYDAIAAGQSPVIAYVDEESDPDYPFSQIEQVASIGVDGDELVFATFSLVDRNLVEYRVATVDSYPETGGQQ